ncbi:MAG TPA: hypothetical protein VKA30_02940 [Actinomycetota bacterium]|nr:hypothetical protein [Actinomycetota bacterium]
MAGAGASRGPAVGTHDVVPVRTRLFVWAFLAAFAVCGAMGVEAWPLTGFRLFSHLRTRDLVTYRTVAVDTAGTEAPVPFGRLPVAYKGFGLIAPTLPALPADRARSACRDLLAAVRDRSPEVAGIRVYRLSTDLSIRDGSRPAGPATRSLIYHCSPGGMGHAPR